ncbi:DNA primase large subunit [Harpegnathos saltator]|uniref:DNA primase large subunit n=1 Tax=Harpegnathos saltator TaxID=610380 RepID=E2BKU3_HARSA|nr:DNA primase large subunit [Harpegnathos saltator]
MKQQIFIHQLPKNLSDMYPHDLQLYQNAPFGEIMLDELQEISETRLKVLTLVERIHFQKLLMSVSKRRAALVEELYKQGLDEFARLINSPGCKSHTDMDIHIRRKDHMSHVILRSVVAFNTVKKRWFFKQEARLFKWRFSSLDNEGIRCFMQIYNFDFTPSAREARANIYNDERFSNIFDHLENSIHIENTILIQDKDVQQYVSLDQLDELSGSSYPCCMRVLHKALRKNHHLTHGGRIQYGLFLKGIGISLSDAMTFWKSEFINIMDEAAFEKEHTYQIRFIFGWEGTRRDYQPYKCSKIMESTVGPRDYHGCPFKHMPRDVLEDELVNCGFNALERSAIMNLSQNGQYSAACNKYYEIKHGCFNDIPFKHPNIYFNECVKNRVLYRNYGEIYFFILYILNNLQFRIKNLTLLPNVKDLNPESEDMY